MEIEEVKFSLTGTLKVEVLEKPKTENEKRLVKDSIARLALASINKINAVLDPVAVEREYKVGRDRADKLLKSIRLINFKGQVNETQRLTIEFNDNL